MKPVTFEDIAVAAARMVTELRQTDKVDLVIAPVAFGHQRRRTGRGRRPGRARCRAST
jgi:2',3'-cyclic-nucleotide 2'-phosphodiesterase (5'-nucleotidase family)